MLFVLSPAKTLDFTPPPANLPTTAPDMAADTARLAKAARQLKAADLKRMMDISDKLAELNVARFKAFRPRDDALGSPAALTFAGDVYVGLSARTLTREDLDWAQGHVRILSGLYGVLRPLAAIQPYRLEMGTRLANPLGANLYNFWGDRLARQLDLLAKASQSNVIVNLASQEYFRAVDRPCLKTPVIECVFEDWKTDRYKIISFFAKRARGLMARFAITERIDDPQALAGFDLDGYKYTGELSTPSRLLFRRRQD